MSFCTYRDCNFYNKFFNSTLSPYRLNTKLKIIQTFEHPLSQPPKLPLIHRNFCFLQTISNKNHSRIAVLQSKKSKSDSLKILYNQTAEIPSLITIFKNSTKSKPSPFYHSLGRSSFNLANKLALLKAFPSAELSAFPTSGSTQAFLLACENRPGIEITAVEPCHGIDQTSRGTQDATGTRVFDPSLKRTRHHAFNRSRRYNSN